jgi:flagellar biosynthesis protein FlhA
MVNAVILCPTPARFHLKRLLEPVLPERVVLSPGEIPPAVPVQTLATLS